MVQQRVQACPGVGRQSTAVTTLCVLAGSEWLEACPMCFGAVSGGSEGAYRGMAVLLTVAIAVLAVTAGFVWRMAARGRRHARVTASWPRSMNVPLGVDVDG